MVSPAAGEPLEIINESDIITSAESAAPASIAKAATVVILVALDHARVVRQGSNGFTCMPDVPETPAPDPICLDEGGMLWLKAWIAHKRPLEGMVGIGYMLAGLLGPRQPRSLRHEAKVGPEVGEDRTARQAVQRR